MKKSVFWYVLITICLTLLCPASAQMVAEHTQVLPAPGGGPVDEPSVDRDALPRHGLAHCGERIRK